jgi:hypothetical protein
MKLCQHCFEDIFSYACVAYETIKIKSYKCSSWTGLCCQNHEWKVYETEPNNT